MRTEIAELVRTAASTLLAHHASGRRCDPLSVRWAQQVLACNPAPQPLDTQPDRPSKEACRGTQSL